MFKELLNVLGGFRLFIEIILLAIGCFCDFDLHSIGTCFRFMCGLLGAWCIVGNADYGMGGIIGLLVGFIGYAFSIRPHAFDILLGSEIGTWLRYSARVCFVFMFVLGVKDVKNC